MKVGSEMMEVENISDFKDAKNMHKSKVKEIW